MPNKEMNKQAGRNGPREFQSAGGLEMSSHLWFFIIIWTIMAGVSFYCGSNFYSGSGLINGPGKNFLLIIPLTFWLIGLVVILLGGRSLQRKFSFFDQNARDLENYGAMMALRESDRRAVFSSRNQWLKSFFDEANVGSFIKNERREFTMVNRCFCSFLNVSPEQLLGDTGYALLSPSVADKIREMEQRVSQEAREMEAHDLFDNAALENGPIVNLSLFPILASDGRLEAFGGILIDFSHQYDKEASLQKAKDAAENADRLKKDFLSTISNEIRTPLNGIAGVADLLLDTELSPEQKSMLSTIRNDSESLMVVLNDILDISKLETGHQVSDRRLFSLRDLIFDGIKGLAPLAQAKSLDIYIQVSPEIPDGLYGDATRLRQLLLNLVSNALKFTNKGGVTVKVELMNFREHDSDSSSDSSQADLVKIRFSIIDTGIGIAPEKQRIIFEALEQVENSAARDYSGTGLGMAISYHLAEMMNSRLHLESQVNKGSSFWFVLDLPVMPEAATSKPQLNPDSFEGYSVIVVDDSETGRHIVSEALRAWSLTVNEASTADEALKMLRAAANSDQPYSLVVCDLQKPKKNGTDFLRSLKSDYLLAPTPVILLSSISLPEEEKEKLPLVANLTKPVRPRDLIRATATALGIWERFNANDIDSADPGPVQKLPVRLSVLLVENLEVNRVVATQMLKDLEQEVVVAYDGAQALALLRDQSFDLIFIALSLPVMDGIETLSHIRRMEEQRGRPRTEIVAMNAFSVQGGRDKYLEIGFDDYLDQPLLLSELRPLINELIKEKMSRDDGLISSSRYSGETEAVGSVLSSGLDQQLMELHLGSNKNLIIKSIKVYINEAPALMDEIMSALEKGLTQEVSSKARALKGISGYYNKSGLCELAASLDKKAYQGNWPENRSELVDLARRLRQSLNELLVSMKKYLDEH